MLIGAINAENDKAGSVLNQITGEWGEVPATAVNFSFSLFNIIIVVVDNEFQRHIIEIKVLDGLLLVMETMERVPLVNMLL
jgi:aconitate hydratase